MTVTYRDAGVDIDAGDKFVEEISPLVATTLRPEVVGSLGGFSGLFSIDTNRYRQPLLVASTDGVGTKLKIANLAGEHSSVGIDLVAMCVNDIIVTGAEPLFFLDYFATSRLDPMQGKQVVSGIVEGCRQAGCTLLGGETAEMPGFYQPGEYDLAGFSVGVVERDKMLGTHRVRAGDALIGFASSGLHSNGFSLVRKVLVDPDPGALGTRVEELDRTLGEELLQPTRIYVRLVLDLLAANRLHALAHITGGGIVGNLPRILPEDLSAEIHLGSWTVPHVFDLVQGKAGLDDVEMRRTFNMGLGMIAVLDPDNLEAVHQEASRHQVESWTIGHLAPRRNPDEAVLLNQPSRG